MTMDKPRRDGDRPSFVERWTKVIREMPLSPATSALGTEDWEAKRAKMQRRHERAEENGWNIPPEGRQLGDPRRIVLAHLCETHEDRATLLQHAASQAQTIEALRAALKAEREACAKIADEWSSFDTMQLRAGEMTAQEKRSVRAVVTAIAMAIRARKTEGE